MAVKSLHELLEKQLGVNVYPRINPEVDAIGTTVTQILSNNPNRVGLTITNIGTNNAYVLIDNTVASDHGILLAANGGAISLNWQYDMSIIAYSWFGIAIGGATDILVVSMEIV